MFDHIAETYLSTEYQKSRDWHSFVKDHTTATSIVSWMAELSDTKGVHVPAHIRPTTEGKASVALQRLFSEEQQDEERRTCENLAKQVVDSLLSVCLEAFRDLFGVLGLPTTLHELGRMTPYELAVAVLAKWRTEDELEDELTELTKSIFSESTQGLIRFAVQAMLYEHDIRTNPKYRGLFVEPQ